MKRTTETWWVVAVGLGLAGCASDAAPDPGGAEDDIRASTHGKAIAACQKAESDALRRDSSAAARLAASKSVKQCMMTANDRTLRQIDVRRGSTAPVTHVQFASYRSDFMAACEGYFTAHPNVLVSRNGASCSAEAEYNLARLLQNNGDLGGDIETTLQFAPWRSTCLERGTVAQMRACVETETRTLLRNESASVQRAFGTALDGANVALCNALTRRRGQAPDTTASDQCRIDAAMLLQSIAPS